MSKNSKKAAGRPGFKPLVYICAPYAGDVETNIAKATEFAKYAHSKGCIPLTTHLLFPFLNDTDIACRADAMYMDIILMGKCEQVWVLSDRITQGMRVEIDTASRRKQVVKYFDKNFVEVDAPCV